MNEKALILPAVKGRLGIRDYYLVTMKIRDAGKRIEFANKYISSGLPSERLQRDVDAKRANKIKSYLIENNEHFFSSLVVGLFGEPKWQKFSDLPEPLDKFEHNIGFLTLSNEDKMYAIDGQHRLEGIKRYYKESCKTTNENNLDETISIVFLQHEDNEEGRKRSRRLFTVLNKKAVKVSKLDIIYLDEDDTAAIITRKFLEDKNSKFFQNVEQQNNRVYADSTQLPAQNTHSFTTIVSLYTSIMDLTVLFTNKSKSYHEDNANEVNIDTLHSNLTIFFDFFIDNIPEIKQYFEADISQMSSIITKNRNNDDGGHVLFRPAGFTRFIKVFCYVYKKRYGSNFDSKKMQVLLNNLSHLPFKLTKEPCINLIWDDTKKVLTSKGFAMLSKVYLHMMDAKDISAKDKENYTKTTGLLLPKKLTVS